MDGGPGRQRDAFAGIGGGAGAALLVVLVSALRVRAKERAFAADAEDLTQEFFARLLEHNWIAHADRHKGRFRSFLLMAMKRFLAKEWDKVKTLKRGGQVRFVPLQFDTAETR